MREWRRCSSLFTCRPEVKSAPISRTRSLLQGDPAATDIFNAVLDEAAVESLVMAQSNKWGYRLDDGKHLPLLLFADNFWLLSTSAAELTRMTQVWLGILSKYGWSVPLHEATWCTTAEGTGREWAVNVHGDVVKRTPHKVGFRALGVQITFDNGFAMELKERFARAWRAFYANSDLLCCRSAPIDKRLRLLEAIVMHSLFWCSSSWNLTARQCSN